MNAPNEPDPDEAAQAARAARLREAISEAKHGKPDAKNPRDVANEAAAEAARKAKGRREDGGNSK